MTRKTILRVIVVVLVLVLLAAGFLVAQRTILAPTRVSAIFTSATAIYVGDDVRVSGVEVGEVAAIEPRGTGTELVMDIDGDVSVPAEATAVIVAQSLVDSRYVQLTPPYRDEGPTMSDDTTIPKERTAAPVEWDEIKTQLSRLSTELGPDDLDGSSSTGRFIESAAGAMDGNGDKLREMLRQLSDAGRVLASGSGNIVDIIENLQNFVTALRDSNVQIVQFENRLATLSSVLDDSKSQLDAALGNLSVAVGEVQHFVANNRDRAGEQVQRLVNVTQNLVDNRGEVEELLHIFPTSMANFYNIYNPDTGTEAGVFVGNNFSNPVQFVCSSIASLEDTTTEESAKKCADYLGPVLGLMNFNYVPTPLNPVLGPSAAPENLIYSEPDLVPQAVGAPQGPQPPSAPGAPVQAPAGKPLLSLPDILFPGGRGPA